MPVFMTASNDIVAFGAENSTLDAVVKRAIAAEGYTLSPDPMPEENIFVRSDQYSFVKQGMPSVYLMPGFTARRSKGERPPRCSRSSSTALPPAERRSVAADGSQGASRDSRDANYRVIARESPNDPVAPTWKPGNFFGKAFGTKNDEKVHRMHEVE